MRKQLYLFLLLMPFVSKGQTYLFDTWNSDNGLAISDVNDITQDPKGYLWLATEGGGISRFDGMRFQHYDVKDGLPSDFVSKLAWDGDSVLCIGTEKGICFYDGSSFYTPDYSQNQDKKRVVGLAFINDTLFVGFRHRLTYYHNGKLLEYGTKGYFKNQTLNSFNAIGNRLLVSCDSGVVNVSGFNRIEKTPHYFHFKNNLFELNYYEGGGELWFQDAGVPILIDTNFIKNGLKDAILWQDSTLVYTNNNGLKLVNAAGVMQNLSSEHGLNIDRVKCLFEDGFGNLWIGGYKGLAKWVNPNIKNYTFQSGLEDERIHAVHAQKNKIWFGTNSGIEMLDQEGYHSFDEVANGVVFKIFEDEIGMLWFATESGLISFYQGAFKTYKEDLEIGDNFVFDITETVDNQLVVATSTSIYIQNDYGFESIFSDKGLGSNTVKIDHYNRIWFNPLLGNLAYWEDNEITYVDALGSYDLSNYRITCFDIQMPDNLWVGTLESGLLFWDGETLEIINEADGLMSEKVVGVLNYDKNNIWVLFENGVQSLELVNNQWVPGKIYDESHGFLGADSYSNSIFRDEVNNKIWVGTREGAVSISQLKEVTNPIKFTPEIQGVDLFFEPTVWANYENQKWSDLPQELNLGYQQNYLTFHFGAISSGNPKDLFYRYKLKGQDENWTFGNERFEAIFTNVSHGHFQFQLEVSSWPNFKNAKLATYNIVIVPPFYKTIWFWAIVVISVGGLVSWYIYSRVNQLNEKIQLKTALADSERKSLRLQMNPHFIFNALESISGFIFKNEPKLAVKYLNSFAKLMRLTLESSRKMLVPLYSEINLIKNYLLLEQVRFNNSFEFTINVNKDIDEYLIVLPPMVIQPNLENAILHGLRHKKENGKLTIDFTITQTELICEIIDDGVGRTFAMKKKTDSKKSHIGLSTNITEERMSLLSKSLAKSFKYQIVDLYHENEEAKGTKVLLTFPLIEDDGFDE